MDKSKDHVMFLDNYEYFKAPDETLYKAKVNNYIGIDGYRVGKRFEATKSMADYRIKALLLF